ncbi:MAG: amidohydrolase family protein [Candidatus Humimicrobiaceae bacterium]
MEFFDINCWVSHEVLENNSVEKKSEYFFSSLSKNNISKVVLTNKLSLTYDWDIGNNDLLNFKELMQNENVFFSFILCPEAYHQFKFSDYIKNAYDNKVRLFRVFPKSQLFYLNDYYMQKVFKEMADANFPLMLDLKELDITGNKYFAINDLKILLNENKKLPVILETSLKQCMFNRFYFPLLEEFENLYLEVSGMLLMDQIEHYIEKFGSERLIFGSNYPNFDLALNTSRIEFVQAGSWEKSNIAYNNLSKLFEKISI